MIKVHPWVYLGFWIGAALGLLASAPMPLLMLSNVSVAFVNENAPYAFLASEVLGLLLVIVSLRRLMRPLRANHEH